MISERISNSLNNQYCTLHNKNTFIHTPLKHSISTDSTRLSTSLSKVLHSLKRELGYLSSDRRRNLMEEFFDDIILQISSLACLQGVDFARFLPGLPPSFCKRFRIISMIFVGVVGMLRGCYQQFRYLCLRFFLLQLQCLPSVHQPHQLAVGLCIHRSSIRCRELLLRLD